MDAKEWLALLAAEIPDQKAGTRTRLLSIAPALASKVQARHLTPDTASAIARDWNGFLPLDSLAVAIDRAASRFAPALPIGGMSPEARQAAIQERVARRMIENGSDPKVILQMSREQDLPGVFERLTADFAPDWLERIAGERREVAEARSRHLRVPDMHMARAEPPRSRPFHVEPAPGPDPMDAVEERFAADLQRRADAGDPIAQDRLRRREATAMVSA